LIRIIPSLLIYNNTLVKGVKFTNYKNAGNPVTTVLGYQSQKADEISLINLNHYKKEGDFDLKILKKISKVCNTPITFGGAVDSFTKVSQIFSSGADKVYISKYFYKNIKFIDKISSHYGSQSIVGGINLVKIDKDYKLLEDETKKLATRLASGPTNVYGNTKKLLYRSLDNEFEAQLQMEAEMFADCASKPNFKEGVTAFIEKRKACFKVE